MTKARAAATEIFDILRTPNNIDPHEGDGARLDHLDGQIQFKNVQFAYPSRKNDPVFSDLELEIPPGEKVALVGPSGGRPLLPPPPSPNFLFLGIKFFFSLCLRR